MASEARALGRGFEEISHLFLSKAETPAQPVPEPVEEPEPEAGARPAPRAGVAVLRPTTALAKNQLTATLAECRDALEPGLRILGAQVPCSPHGDIDILAVDRGNRLTIVNVAIAQEDEQLIRGLGHVDWAASNMAGLRRAHAAVAIDGGLQPRLMLVAPSYSPLLTSALRQLAGPSVRCFVYRTVAASDRPAIFVEPVS